MLLYLVYRFYNENVLVISFLLTINYFDEQHISL